MIFLSPKKYKSKWSQNSIIRNFVRKWNKLPRALRKENSKKKIFKRIKGRDAKKTRTISNGQKIEGFKSLIL